MAVSNVKDAPKVIEAVNSKRSPALEKNQFARKSAVYIFGNLLEKTSQFLLIPLYTRLLSTEEFGFYSAALAFTSVLIPLLDLGISSSLIRFIHEYSDSPNRLLRYLKLSFWQRLSSSFISSVLCAVLLYYSWNFFFRQKPASPAIVLWIVLLPLGTTITEFVCAYYRATYQAVLFVIGKVGQTLLQSILTVIVLFFVSKSTVGIIAAQATGACVGAFCIALVFYIRTVYPARKLAVNLQDIKYNLAYGVPLIPHQIGNWLRTASDRVIMSKYAPMSDVGLYQLASSVANVIGALIMCLDMVYEPLYYRIRRNQKTAYISTVQSYNSFHLVMMGLLCLAIMLFSGELITIIAPPAYAGAAKIAPLVIAAIYLQGQYTLVVKPLFYHKKTKVIPFLTLLPAAAGVLANFLLLPHFGLMAVVWVNLSVYLLTFLAVFFASHKIDNTGYPVVLGIVCNVALLTAALFLTFNPVLIWSIASIGVRMGVLIILLAAGWISVAKNEYAAVKHSLVW